MSGGQRRSSSPARSMTLEHIRASGLISRVELAQLSGLTPASISGIVAKTIADGLVVESGFSDSTGGKRRTLLRLNAAARHAVGITLDRSRLTFVITDLSGQLCGRLVSDGAGDEEPGPVLQRAADQLRALLDHIQVDPTTVVGIGVASPGPLDNTGGRLLNEKPSPAWHGFPLTDELARRSHLPVLLDNDATCAAVGEYWLSNGNPAAVAATVYMSDGIGCGVLLRGAAFHGSSSNPGELGHLSLNVNGPACSCGSRGCLEFYAAPAAVADRAWRDSAVVAQLGLDPRDSVLSTFARIGRGASRGEPTCLGLIEESASYLGSAIVALNNILDLDEVHLSGPGFAAAGAIYGRIVRQRLQEASFTRRVHPVDVLISRTGTDSAALGAAALVLQRAITPHALIN